MVSGVLTCCHAMVMSLLGCSKCVLTCCQGIMSLLRCFSMLLVCYVIAKVFFNLWLGCCYVVCMGVLSCCQRMVMSLLECF